MNLKLTWTTSGILWITLVPAVLFHIHQKGSFFKQGRHKPIRGQIPHRSSRIGTFINLFPQTWGWSHWHPSSMVCDNTSSLVTNLGAVELACLDGSFLKPSYYQSCTVLYCIRSRVLLLYQHSLVCVCLWCYLQTLPVRNHCYLMAVHCVSY